MNCRFLLDVVVRQCPSLFQLLPSKYKPLLVRPYPLLVLDLALDHLDCICRFHLERDRLAGQRLDKDLHAHAMLIYASARPGEQNGNTRSDYHHYKCEKIIITTNAKTIPIPKDARKYTIMLSCVKTPFSCPVCFNASYSSFWHAFRKIPLLCIIPSLYIVLNSNFIIAGTSSRHHARMDWKRDLRLILLHTCCYVREL